MQVAALGGGAWLVVQNRLLAGSMVAGSIIISRTLQPARKACFTAWRALNIGSRCLEPREGSRHRPFS